MSLDSVRQQEQNSVFVLSASKYCSEKSDFSSVVLTYPILKSKFLTSTKFATGQFLLAAAHIFEKQSEIELNISVIFTSFISGSRM